MIVRRALWLVLALLALSCVSCSSTPVPKWYEVPCRGLTNEDVHEKCVFALKLSDLKIAKSDLATGRIETQWDENLAPFHRPKGEGNAGFRRRAFVEINPNDDPAAGPNAKTIRVRCERERNDERMHPADTERAKWIPDADDENKAHEIAVQIKERVTPFEPSDDFKRRYGFDTKDPAGGAGSKPAGGDKPKNP